MRTSGENQAPGRNPAPGKTSAPGENPAPGRNAPAMASGLAFAWQSIRARRAGFVASFLAVLGGAVLVTACGVLLQSGLFAGIAPQRYAAAPVVVGAAQSVTAVDPEGPDLVETLPERAMLPAELVERIAAVPGVRSATGEISFPATLLTEDGRPVPAPSGHEVLGHGWGSAELTPYTLREGAAPRGDGEVVLDAATAGRAGAGVGSTVRIATADGVVPYRVVGVAAARGADELPRQSALFFTDDRARALSGHPREVVAVAVVGDPGVRTAAPALLAWLPTFTDDTLTRRVTDALEKEGYGTDRAVVRAGVERGEVEFIGAAQSRSVLTLVSSSFSGFVLMIVLLVVAGTLSLVVHQRRREIALLRAVAATPRQIHRMLATEAQLVAGAAALLGVAPGYLAAQALRDGFARIGVIEEGFTLSLGPVPAVVAVLLCLGTARLAVWAAARRQVRIGPVAALRESTVERPDIGRGRIAGGYVVLGLAAVALVAVAFVPQNLATLPAVLCSMLALIAAAMLGPRLMAALARIAGAGLLRHFRVSGYLAAANSAAGSRRLAAAVTPLALTIGFASSQFYSQTTLSEATQYQARQATVAPYVVTGPGGVAPDVAAAARRVPGVTAATPLVATEVVAVERTLLDERLSRSRAYGVDAGGLRGTLDLPVAEGTLGDLRGDTVALSETEARYLRKGIGDRVNLALGDGTRVQPRVVAVFRPNLGFGDVLLPAATVVPHTTDRLADTVLVATAPDANGAAVAEALGALSADHPGLAVGDRTALQAAQDAQTRSQDWLNRLLLAVILGYVALSSATTLVTTTTARTRELALLRLSGGTRAQIARMLTAETTFLAATAAVLGTVTAALPLAVLSFRLTTNPLPAGPPWVFAAIVATVVLTAVLAIRIPAGRVLRAHPLEAMRAQS
ncbi:ABC transporter permease [Streptomyces sp. NPDC088124]|uniref:ABC transporter permease n=1 Tax=Streptomyces sp. NPDC088124 TaxID=3154654 RepID=UPI0034342D4E